MFCYQKLSRVFAKIFSLKCRLYVRVLYKHLFIALILLHLFIILWVFLVFIHIFIKRNVQYVKGFSCYYLEFLLFLFLFLQVHRILDFILSVCTSLSLEASLQQAWEHKWSAEHQNPVICNILAILLKSSCVSFYNSHVHLEETLKHINAFNIRQLHTIP
jgi:hypothetical protein